METTGRRQEETTMLCRILAMPVKHWLLILALIVLFLALYVVVYAGETGVLPCDLQSGLAGVLNLSQQQCEDIQRAADRFFNDAADIRNKIVEKRVELKNLSKIPKADPNVLDKKGLELRALEQELSRKARQAELNQKRHLTPQQLNKINDTVSTENFLRPERKENGTK